MSLKAGYAEATITPTLDRPVYLAGFGQNRRAESVHDDLYVRVLALGDGAGHFALAAVDLIGLARVDCREIEAAVAAAHPGTQVVVAATHTHHGPDTLGLWGPDQATRGVDEAYLAATKQAIVAAILTARGNLAPAVLRSTALTVGGVAKNARQPAIKDEELTCVQLCRPQAGTPIATLAIYPCHPEVLWDQNPHISADYCATLRTTLEAATGGPALAVVGALGGMMTPDMGANTFEAAAQMGAILGEAGTAALAPSTPQAVGALAYGRVEFDLPFASPLLQLALDAGLLRSAPNPDGTLTTECSLLRLGDTFLLCVPGELLPRLGLQYKQAMRQAGARVAAVVGLANDEIGYILPAEEFVYPDNPFAPGDHYEETMSIGIEAGPRLSAAVDALLHAAESRAA
jgi:hypothetical protein